MKKYLIAIIALSMIVALTSCMQSNSRTLDNDFKTVFKDITGSSMSTYFDDYDIPKDVDSYINQNKVDLEDLKEQLAMEKDLPLFEGQLGGTPYIIIESIQLVDQQWLYCIAEDGHIQSDVLIKFLITQEDAENKVLFRVCAVDVNEQGTKQVAFDYNE